MPAESPIPQPQPDGPGGTPPRQDLRAALSTYYEPLIERSAVTAKLKGFLGQPEITTPQVFESIADSFAVFSGDDFESNLRDGGEGYFEHPELGEIDLAYYRYKTPDDNGSIEDAFIQLGHDSGAPTMSFYRKSDASVIATKILDSEVDEDEYEPSQEEKKAIVQALVEGLEGFPQAADSTPSNP